MPGNICLFTFKYFRPRAGISINRFVAQGKSSARRIGQPATVFWQLLALRWQCVGRPANPSQA
eukprot:3677510-Alexandrium_andersonii.AAC.1